MSPRGSLVVATVVATVDATRGNVYVSAADVSALLATANVRYRITGSGGAIIDTADLSDLEVACAATFRPIRIQARRSVIR